jgi:hypothetical protein
MDKGNSIIINYWIESLSLSDNLRVHFMNSIYLLNKEKHASFQKDDRFTLV